MEHQKQQLKTNKNNIKQPTKEIKLEKGSILKQKSILEVTNNKSKEQLKAYNFSLDPKEFENRVSRVKKYMNISSNTSIYSNMNSRYKQDISGKLNNSYNSNLNQSFNSNTFSGSKLDQSQLKSASRLQDISSFRAPLFKNYDKYKERRNQHKAYDKYSKVNHPNFNSSREGLHKGEQESNSQLSNSRYDKPLNNNDDDFESPHVSNEQDKHSIQKYIYGYIPKYDLQDNYNLNLDRNFIEDYKYFQDKNYMTRTNFAKNHIVPTNKVEGHLKDRVFFEKDILYKDNKRYEEESRLDFYRNIRVIDSINDEYTYLKETPDYTSTYLNNCKHMGLYPSPTGIIRRDGKKIMIGTNRINALIQTYHMMTDDDYPEVMDFTDNNLQTNTSVELIRTFKIKISKIYLNGNSLSLEGAKVFAGKIEELPNLRIEQLNLMNTKLGDRGGKLLIEKFVHLRYLSYLNMAENELGNASGEALFEFFETKCNVETLILNNNSFNANNLRNFLSSINNYENLKTIDLAWNKIGSNSEIFKKFASNLGSNASILHLDISNNYIIKADCIELGRGIRQNFMLAGLHLAGNEGYVDGCGYVHAHIDMTSIMNNYLHRGLETLYDQYNSDMRLNCWICEKWVPIEFNVQNVEEPVFLHLEWYDYQPFYMGSDGNEEFRIKTMCPPGTWKFFFTSKLGYVSLSQSYDICANLGPKEFNYVYDEKKPELSTCTFDVTDMNVITLEANKDKDQGANFYKEHPLKPRYLQHYEYSDSKVGWSISVSIWSKWITDEAEKDAKCFDNDWALIGEKIPKVLKDDEAEKNKIKQVLRPKYRLIRNFYKYWASMDLVYNTWTISEGRFYELFDYIKFFDEYFNREAIPIIFRETISSDRNPYGALAPVNGCVRHQFLNFILKSCIRKYKTGPKSKIAVSKSCSIFIELYAKPLEEFDPAVWRWNHLYLEPVDIYFKRVKDIMEELFLKYQTTSPGEKPYLIVNDFIEMLRTIKIYEFIKEDIIKICFNYSMSVYIDETKSDTHIKMRNRLEFFETWARIAHNLKFPLKMEEVDQKSLGITVTYPTGNYDDFDLGDKLWCLLPHVFLCFQTKNEAALVDYCKKTINKYSKVKVK